MKRRIALFFGGQGVEHKISESSAYTLYTFIDKAIYEVLPIGIKRDGSMHAYLGNPEKIKSGEWATDESLYPVKLVRGGIDFCTETKKTDLAIIALHGDFGEDGILQGALSAHQIDYIGEDTSACAASHDKAYTKAIARLLSIPTAEWVISYTTDAAEARRIAEAALSYPMFIKPARLGSSFGAHPVLTASDFESAYLDARSMSKRVLVEEKIDVAYELECAYLGLKPGTYAVGRVNSGGKFYDYDKKYQKGSDIATEITDGNDEISRLATEYAEDLRRYIGIEDLSRFDFLVSKGGTLYFNEINSIPGMTETSLYPLLTEKMGYRRCEFINLLIKKHLSK